MTTAPASIRKSPDLAYRPSGQYPWILDNGLHCGNSPVQAANWINIGNPELIGKHAGHPVPVGTGGTLRDYVPFYLPPSRQC